MIEDGDICNIDVTAFIGGVHGDTNATFLAGDVSEEARKRYGWERQLALPTAGVIVKGCLDDCDVCEPSLDREIALELERKALENGATGLLTKPIDFTLLREEIDSRLAAAS